MKLTINSKTTLLFYIAITAVITVLIIYYFNTRKVKLTSGLVEHTQDVLRKSDEILLDVINIETEARAYILTQNESFLEPFNKGIKSIDNNLAALKALTKDNPNQQLRIDSMIQTGYVRTIELKKNIEDKEKNRLNETQEKLFLTEGLRMTGKIKDRIAAINAEEFSLLKQRKLDSDQSNRNTEWVFLWLLFSLIAFATLIAMILSNYKMRHQDLENYTASQKLLSNYSLSLIEASLDPLVTINTEGKITDMNEAMVTITGKNREILRGSDFFDYFTEPQKAREVYQDVFEKGFVINQSLTMKDGKPTDVLFNGSVYRDEQGIVLGAVVVARDVTKQNLLEKSLTEYKHFFNESTDFVCIINLEGNFEVINKNFETVLGYSEQELLSHTLMTFLHPEDIESTLQEISNIQKGDMAIVFANRYRKKDGTFIWIDWKSNFNPISRKIYATGRDITEQKRIKVELLEAKVFAELATGIAEVAQKKAEIATKSKQQFLSNMSHEIRTPLNSIIGFTKVVLKTDLSDKQKEYLTAIKMSGDTLIVLINDILDLAKVDAGKMTFERTPFKLSSSISAMLHIFETKIQEKNLVLVKEYDDNIPNVLVGDPIRLHQIILNLVSNAVKFTSKGRIAISVKLLKEEGVKIWVEFAVADSGIGIQKDKMESIFENFQQASSDTTRLYGGTGLGLAISKQLVESQGGSISVENNDDNGATFSFILSFLKTDEDAEVATEIIELDKELKNIKVLVVEDMPLNQLLMKTILDDFGFERDIADNGKIAIEKLKMKSYDIILMDLQMPEINGFEATEYIRKTLKFNIPIIALTADVTTVDVAKCKAVGMNDYVTKPVDERLLYSKIIGLVKKANSIVALKTMDIASSKKIKYTNMAYLTQRTKSNPTMMIEIITAYLAQTPTLIREMKQSFYSQDWDMLHTTVHKMIPSFSIMGISNDFESMAKKVMEHARLQQENHDILDFVTQLESVCLQAREELLEEMNRIKVT
jgi:PAS domain S-box-containing protein